MKLPDGWRDAPSLEVMVHEALGFGADRDVLDWVIAEQRRTRDRLKGSTGGT